jgi:hypothetical protein
MQFNGDASSPHDEASAEEAEPRSPTILNQIVELPGARGCGYGHQSRTSVMTNVGVSSVRTLDTVPHVSFEPRTLDMVRTLRR